MIGQRQVDQAALFYEFSLERHVPAPHLGNFTYATFVPTRPTKLRPPAKNRSLDRASTPDAVPPPALRAASWDGPQASPLALGVLPFKLNRDRGEPRGSSPPTL